MEAAHAIVAHPNWKDVPRNLLAPYVSHFLFQQQMLEMINSLVMLTFFDIFDCDAVLKEFFAHESY